MSDVGRRFEFDGYVVDLDNASISKAGAPIHLEPRAYSVLQYLLERPGRLVSKEELLESVWQDAFVTENSLARAVGRVRQALGDDAREPRYIETVHTLGYRFIGDLAEAGPQAPTSEAATPAETAHTLQAGQRASRSSVAGLALLAASVVLVSIWLTGREPGSDSDWPRAPGADAASKVRLAVLPFKNLGPPEDPSVAPGLTEELTNALASLPDLAVISRQSADHYAGRSVPLGQIGAELSVDYLLEGSVRWGESEGETPVVRATAQLIRVADDTHVWSRSYDRRLGAVLQTESWLTRQIVRDLEIPGVALEPAAEPRSAPEQRGAYQAYLQALALIRSTHPSSDDLAEAVALLNRTVDLDPEYVDAWCYLTLAHAANHWLYDPSDEVREQSYAAAERARVLAPDLPLTHAALGVYYFYGLRDYDRALEHTQIAWAGRPNDDFVAAGIGMIWRRQGRTEEAAEQLEVAAGLNPLSSQIALWQGWTTATLGRYEEARRHFDRAISLAPEAVRAHRAKVRLEWLEEGDLQGARDVLEALPEAHQAAAADLWFRQELYERRPEAACALLDGRAEPRVGLEVTELLRAECLDLQGLGAEALGAYEAARVFLQTAAERAPEQPAVHAQLGLALAGLGRREEALSAGHRAVELLPVSRDAVTGYRLLLALALIHTRLGETEAATTELERLLEGPSRWLVSPALLAIDPRFDPLRESPRFRRLSDSVSGS